MLPSLDSMIKISLSLCKVESSFFLYSPFNEIGRLLKLFLIFNGILNTIILWMILLLHILIYQLNPLILEFNVFYINK